MKDPNHPAGAPSGGISRRKFLGSAALTAAAFYIVPRHVLGGPGYTAPSDMLNIAGIGVGGRGKAVLTNMSSQNIVALCDVDDTFAAKTFEQFPAAKRYRDYRQMLDKQKDIDAVMIATPDHTHAVIAMAALKMGKHLYVEKPLTFTIQEARVLTRAAREAKVITQMGNQGHSSDDARRLNEYLRAGAIGEVTEVQAWTNRPIWPQGMERPKEKVAVPKTLDWDLFLGPAPLVAYHPAYTPFKWRGWVDYGVGAIGDMGAHLIDHAVWALELGPPVSVEATSTPFNKVSHPLACMITYEFAARSQKRPPVRLTWYDGGLMPPRPEELPAGENMNKTGGVLYLGTKGKLIHETYGNKPRLLPAAKFEQMKEPPQLFQRVGMSHEMAWVQACKDKVQPSSSFDYAGPLTETMLLGVVATKVPGKKLFWDAATMQVTNAPEANQHLSREYRTGWSL